MRIAVCGLGKLGLPVALAWASQGHDVVGYDVSPHAKNIMTSRRYPYLEPGAQRLLDEGITVRVVDSVEECVAHGDIVFVAVQTPHGPEYEGTTRMPETRADFDYTALCRAVRAVAVEAENQKKHVAVTVISTVLPGTCAREVVPLLNEYASLVYAPMFIAQTTVVEDALQPEFVLLGIDRADARAVELTKAFFTSMHAPEKLRFMSVVSAELTKVAYNVALTTKITIANYLMEIAHRTGANVDDVTDALAKATDRVISSKYLRGGMPDAGSCHPRDIIALSWLSEQLDLTHDFFGTMVRSREAQAEFIADVAREEAHQAGLSIVVLGKAYKRGTNLVIGSSATLLKNILEEDEGQVLQWDPYIDERMLWPPSVFIIATNHDEFVHINKTPTDIQIPAGSTIVDPWGTMPDVEGVKVVRIGR